jgi:hypothetical protein
METNVKVLAWLHIVLGILGIMIGCFFIAIMMSAGVFSGDRTAIGVITIAATIAVALTLLLSAPGIVAGIGLLQYRSWARVMALVLAFFNLLLIPHGTVFGVYTLISLLNTDAAALFNK